jgi:hypothetical protein
VKRPRSRPMIARAEGDHHAANTSHAARSWQRLA